jgi:hypothetical protein
LNAQLGLYIRSGTWLGLCKEVLILYPYQGFSNCGTPATVQWYMGIIRKNQRGKNKKKKP